MRIGIFYDPEFTGRNDGNPLYIRSQLDRLKGCETVRLCPRPGLKVEDYGKFDFYVWVDWGEDAFHDYPRFTCPRPNIYWASDTHLGYAYRLEKAKEFDVVFTAQKDAVEKFKNDGIVNVSWLPHAAEPLAYPKISVIKKYDIGFVGHLNTLDRVEAIDRMFREVPRDDQPLNYRKTMFYWGVKRFEDAAQKICESRIAFNLSIKNDINMRVFETLCCGGFLLTNNLNNNGMLDLFPGHDKSPYFADYETLDEAVVKAKYYLEHDEERESIARKGHEWVRGYHTFGNRVDKMLREIVPFVDKKCSDEIFSLLAMGENKYYPIVKDDNGIYSQDRSSKSDLNAVVV